MSAGPERDALVSAEIALRRLSRAAYAEGARRAAIDALAAANKAKEALGRSGGCPGCGDVVVPVSRMGRPRRWCSTCRPPESRRKVSQPSTVES
jgi:formamidopyrimidine-DNA glycosylase